MDRSRYGEFALAVVSSLVASGIFAVCAWLVFKYDPRLFAYISILAALIVSNVFAWWGRHRFDKNTVRYTAANLKKLEREVKKRDRGEVSCSRLTSWDPNWNDGRRKDVRRRFRLAMDDASAVGVRFRRLHSLYSQSDVDALYAEVVKYDGNIGTSIACFLGLDPRILPEPFLAGRYASLALPELIDGKTPEMGGGILLVRGPTRDSVERYYDLLWSAATVVLKYGVVDSASLNKVAAWVTEAGLAVPPGSQKP